MPERPKIRCFTEIDLDAIRANTRLTRSLLPPGCRLAAVVKADAYGHGIRPVSRALAGVADAFAVASLGEALELPGGEETLILGPALDGEREEIVRRGYIPLLSSIEEARAYAALHTAGGAEIHLAVDTGMGRIGFPPAEAESALVEILRMGHLRVTGWHTHLPSADEDADFTREQLKEWHSLVVLLRAIAPEANVCHALNSAGILGFAGAAGSLVRAGLMLYGVSPLSGQGPRLEPALSWRSRITLVRSLPPGSGISYGRTFITTRETRVATVAVGYADGLPRSISNRGAYFLVRGRRCPLLGRVTMDQIMIDVSGVPDAAPGDPVTLIGRDGPEALCASQIATWAETIPWEILTGIQPRVRRLYLDAGGTKSLLA